VCTVKSLLLDWFVKRGVRGMGYWPVESGLGCSGFCSEMSFLCLWKDYEKNVVW
jgi:hypothetical protein